MSRRWKRNLGGPGTLCSTWDYTCFRGDEENEGRIWGCLLLASTVAAFPYGLIVLPALLAAGYFIYRVIRERMENKEDDYYEKNIKQ